MQAVIEMNLFPSKSRHNISYIMSIRMTEPLGWGTMFQLKLLKNGGQDLTSRGFADRVDTGA